MVCATVGGAQEVVGAQKVQVACILISQSLSISLKYLCIILCMHSKYNASNNAEHIMMKRLEACRVCS